MTKAIHYKVVDGAGGLFYVIRCSQRWQRFVEQYRDHTAANALAKYLNAHPRACNELGEYRRLQP